MKKLYLFLLLVLLTFDWSRTVFGQVFEPETIFIEAEEFDASDSQGVNPGQHANFGDPECSLADRDATPDVDFHRADYVIEQEAMDIGIYRPATGVEASKPGLDPVRGDYTLTCNYVVGWNSSGDWFNYTRNFPTNRYNIYARLASGGAAEHAELDMVTNGVGTKIQKLRKLGEFSSPASGGWNVFHDVPLRDNEGNLVSVRLGGETTLRFTVLPGALDFNYLMFVPTAVQVLPPSASFTPANGGFADYGTNTQVTVLLRDEDTKVVAVSLRLWVDGAEVTTNTTISDTISGATIKYRLSGTTNLMAAHQGKVAFKDSEGRDVSYDWNWFNSPFSTNNLVIEAEDFNYDGGKYLPSNPLRGKLFNEKELYRGAVAVQDTDVHGDNKTSATVNYRETSPNITLTTISPVDAMVRGAGPRPVFNDYRIGWNDVGEWYNYTRHFPPGDYFILARLSSGGADINAELGLVDDGAIPASNQVITKLGSFKAPATRGYNAFVFVGLKNESGEFVQIRLAGEQTLRFTVLPGNLDFNYLMLVPAPPLEPPRLTIRLDGNAVVIEWAGGGTLQLADEATGPWTNMPDAKSPVRITSNSAQKFARVVRR